MIDKVAMFCANRYEKVKEEVKEIMGGQILDYEAKDIRNKGIQLGITIGKEEGKQEEIKNLVNKMHKNGFTAEQNQYDPNHLIFAQ